MRTISKTLTALVAAATLAGGLATATESSAAPARVAYHGGYGYRGGGYYRGGNGGAAVAAGVAGLALGAALAGGGGYYGAPGYYGYAYPAYGYYGPPARTCLYWRHDRYGRPYRVSGWC